MSGNVQVMHTSLKQKARLELNEYEDSVPGILNEFRSVINGVEFLVCPMDDAFLLRFLRARKFQLDSSLKLLKQYYQMRRDHSDLFKNLSPKFLLPSLDQKLQVVLKQRDKFGRRVFIFQAGQWNPSQMTLDEIFRCNYLMLEEMTSESETQINGVIAIVDFKGFSFYQTRQFTPPHALRIVNIIQDKFPCRFQEFHIVNQPYVFNVMFSLVKPFLSDKIKQRIHFHSDLKSLHDSVGPKLLPTFLAGVVNWDSEWEYFINILVAKDEHYKVMGQYGFIS